MDILTNLAEKAGISSSYIDKTGKTHNTSDDVRKFFLGAMGFNTSTSDEIDVSLGKLEEKKIVDEVLAFYDDEKVEFKIKSDGRFVLEIKDEKNKKIKSLEVLGNENVVIEGLEFGYYNIDVLDDKKKKVGESFIIYAPKYCYLPKFIENKEHVYGVSLMMYALKSHNSMGIGDFGDLEEIIRLTAKNGGDVIGLSPLGAMSPYTLPSSMLNLFKGDVSPYRTLSRMFLNYAYIDLRKVEEFENSKALKEFMEDSGVINELKRLNDSDMVLYTQVLQLKLRMLNMMYDEFWISASKERMEAFEKYKEEKGEELFNLSLFEALLERNKNVPFWRFWMDGTSDINSEVVKEFTQNNERKIINFESVIKMFKHF